MLSYFISLLEKDLNEFLIKIIFIMINFQVKNYLSVLSVSWRLSAFVLRLRQNHLQMAFQNKNLKIHPIYKKF